MHAKGRDAADAEEILRKGQAKEVARRIAHTGWDVGVKQMAVNFCRVASAQRRRAAGHNQER